MLGLFHFCPLSICVATVLQYTTSTVPMVLYPSCSALDNNLKYLKYYGIILRYGALIDINIRCGCLARNKCSLNSIHSTRTIHNILAIRSETANCI